MGHTIPTDVFVIPERSCEFLKVPAAVFYGLHAMFLTIHIKAVWIVTDPYCWTIVSSHHNGGMNIRDTFEIICDIISYVDIHHIR